eukprot:564528-Hanusia_phi.AAC.1
MMINISSVLNPENIVKACNCYQSIAPAEPDDGPSDNAVAISSESKDSKSSEEVEQEKRRSLSQRVASLRHSSGTLSTSLQDQKLFAQEDGGMIST